MTHKMTRKPKKLRTAKTAARRRHVKTSTGAKNSAKSMANTRGERRAPTKATQSDVIDSLVAASAQALGLPLDPAWQDDIKFNLRLILRHAALVDEFHLPDDAEPAPVFHA